jgi:hypothetical protein
MRCGSTRERTRCIARSGDNRCHALRWCSACFGHAECGRRADATGRGELSELMAHLTDA